MNKTPNYNLNQWEPEDRVLRADFNADNAKLDAAIRAVNDKADALSGSKADQSALEAEVQTREAADRAIHATLSAHAQSMTKLGNCQIYVIPYTGGGEDNPQSITFPDRPVLVFLMHGSHAFAPCAYGTGLSRTVGYSPDTSFSVSWSENTLSWAGYAMNTKNVGYQAVALCAKD